MKQLDSGEYTVKAKYSGDQKIIISLKISAAFTCSFDIFSI